MATSTVPPSKSFEATLCGVRTQFVLTAYANRVFVIVTQTQNVGTLVRRATRSLCLSAFLRLTAAFRSRALFADCGERGQSAERDGCLLQHARPARPARRRRPRGLRPHSGRADSEAGARRRAAAAWHLNQRALERALPRGDADGDRESGLVMLICT